MNRQSDTGLERTLGFWALLAYGIGDILGAGIYALTGKVAGLAGTAAWASFGIAMAVAGVTALTYSELVTRYPHAGGEAQFCQKAFGRPRVSLFIGWLVFASGVVSLATITRAFSGYATEFWAGLPTPVGILVILVILTAINFWGIRQSSTTNIVCTIIEASGLLFVLIVGALYLVPGEATEAAATVDGETVSWLLILQGSTLAFFAFIGFEDMVNVAEEVKKPAQHFPAAILLALVIAGTGYMLIAYVATHVVPAQTLGGSEAPLMEVVRIAAPATPEWLFTAIALFAVANTGLLNFIMASRLLFGMAREGLLPDWLDAVHPARRTPHRAIGVVFIVALGLALSGTLVYLAGTTSVLLLLVFIAVNASLLFMKLARMPHEDGFRVPVAVPVLGAASCAALIFFVDSSALISALVIAGLGVLLIVGRSQFATFRPGDTPPETGP